MSCSECERGSDTNQRQCPPKMADGRAFTDYRTRCNVQTSLLQEKEMNSYELRQFLINNAESIMQTSRSLAEKQNHCGPCVQPWNQGTMLPEESLVKCNTSTCQAYVNDPYGLGQGRDYGIPNDEAFISKQKARQQAARAQHEECCTGYDDDLKYYPLSHVAEERLSIPSGGKLW